MAADDRGEASKLWATWRAQVPSNQRFPPARLLDRFGSTSESEIHTQPHTPTCRARFLTNSGQKAGVKSRIRRRARAPSAPQRPGSFALPSSRPRASATRCARPFPQKTESSAAGVFFQASVRGDVSEGSLFRFEVFDKGQAGGEGRRHWSLLIEILAALSYQSANA